MSICNSKSKIKKFSLYNFIIFLKIVKKKKYLVVGNIGVGAKSTSIHEAIIIVSGYCHNYKHIVIVAKEEIHSFMISLCNLVMEKCIILTNNFDNKNLFVGMLSATASLGLILLWDVDGGLTQIDKYLYSSEDYIKVPLYM